VHVLLLADTHVPKRALDLPDELWSAVADADAVVHAGDWIDGSLLDRLQAKTPRLLACYGNNDGNEVRRLLPETDEVEWEGVRVAVVHETGGAAGREQRADRRFPHTDLLVFGHSHIPWESVTPAGMRMLNPGSPTDRRRQPYPTYQTVDLEAGRIVAVTTHRLPLPQTRSRTRVHARSRQAGQRSQSG
jgi:putative phosphoesterase